MRVCVFAQAARCVFAGGQVAAVYKRDGGALSQVARRGAAQKGSQGT